MNEFELGTGFPLYYSPEEDDDDLKMSLIIAMKAPGSIIVAADGRAIELPGFSYKDDFRKIYEIDGFVFGCVGAGGYGDFLFDKFKENNQHRPYSKIASLADDMSISFSESYRRYKKNRPRVKLGFILAGYNRGGDAGPEPIIYFLSCPDFFPERRRGNIVSLGMNGVAKYIFKTHEPKLINLNREAIISFLKYVIEDTSLYNVSVGGKITIMEVSPPNMCNTLSDVDVKEAINLYPEDKWKTQ